MSWPLVAPSCWSLHYLELLAHCTSRRVRQAVSTALVLCACKLTYCAPADQGHRHHL